MNTKRPTIVRNVLLAFTLMAVALGATAHATILTLNDDVGGPVVANNVAIPAAYGDNVTALTSGSFGYGVGSEGFTPNVTVEWGSQADPINAFVMRLWNSGYGDLVNVAWAGTTMLVQITHTSLGLVQLLDFDVASFNPALPDGSITITDGNNTVLYSTGNVVGLYPKPGHNTIDLTSSNIIASVIKINLTGASGNYGIDNIRFGEVIPEPSTVSLLAMAAMGVMGYRRRRV